MIIAVLFLFSGCESLTGWFKSDSGDDEWFVAEAKGKKAELAELESGAMEEMFLQVKEEFQLEKVGETLRARCLEKTDIKKSSMLGTHTIRYRLLKTDAESALVEDQSSEEERLHSTLEKYNDALTFAEKLGVLCNAYDIASSSSYFSMETATVTERLNNLLDNAKLSISPANARCEYGEGFNLFTEVRPGTGDNPGVISLDILEENGEVFDTIKTNEKGIYFGSFAAEKKKTLGNHIYTVRLGIGNKELLSRLEYVPSVPLHFHVERISVTADIKVEEELYSDRLADMFREFITGDEAELNLVVPGTKEQFNIELELYTGETVLNAQGVYSTALSGAFHISDRNGVVIYVLQTDEYKAEGASMESMAETALSKLLSAARQDKSFMEELKGIIYRE